ncbi:MAG: hypothetical protein JWQ68_758 [Cryobacterium sp.]|jgi:hypothetical protein|nr:hypothetical protein [Cryobacterium sp.]
MSWLGIYAPADAHKLATSHQGCSGVRVHAEVSQRPSGDQPVVARCEQLYDFVHAL